MRQKKQLMAIVLIGQQGCGKGTQARLLAEKYKLKHIEVGNLLRQIAKEKNSLGKKVDQLINKEGKMIPRDLVIQVIDRAISKATKNEGLILDGTPRRQVEIAPLEKILSKYSYSISYIFYLKISKAITISRLGKRRVCQQCGRSFIAGVDITLQQKKCSFCGGQIIRRIDDRPMAIRQRLAIYQTKTQPVIKYYQQQKKLIEINGKQPIKKVFRDIVQYLDDYYKK